MNKSWWIEEQESVEKCNECYIIDQRLDHCKCFYFVLYVRWILSMMDPLYSVWVCSIVLINW